MQLVISSMSYVDYFQLEYKALPVAGMTVYPYMQEWEQTFHMCHHLTSFIHFMPSFTDTHDSYI